MTKVCVFCRTLTTTAKFSYFSDLELNAGITYLAKASFVPDKRTDCEKTSECKF